VVDGAVEPPAAVTAAAGSPTTRAGLS
jgi:hypothetical protein